MAGELAAEELTPLELGAVLSTAFGLLRRHPLIVFGLSLVLAAIPVRLLYSVDALLASQPSTTTANTLLPFLGGIVLKPIVGGMLIGTAFIANEGRRANLAAALGPGFQRLIPLLLVGLLYALGCVIGLILLAVPFFFFWTRWAVVGPVVVAEEISVTATFGRSSELTKGTRLRILGLLLLSSLIQIIFSATVIYLGFRLAGLSRKAEDFTTDPVTVVIKTLVEMVNFGFAASVQCALYLQLKQRRDGPLADQLSAIFA